MIGRQKTVLSNSCQYKNAAISEYDNGWQQVCVCIRRYMYLESFYSVFYDIFITGLSHVNFIYHWQETLVNQWSISPYITEVGVTDMYIRFFPQFHSTIGPKLLEGKCQSLQHFIITARHNQECIMKEVRGEKEYETPRVIELTHAACFTKHTQAARYVAKILRKCKPKGEGCHFCSRSCSVRECPRT